MGLSPGYVLISAIGTWKVNPKDTSNDRSRLYLMYRNFRGPMVLKYFIKFQAEKTEYNL